MACLVVLVHIDAASAHNSWDVVFTNESVPCFKAPATTERVHYVINAQDHVAEDSILGADVHVRQFVDVDCFLGAQDRVVHVYALTQEQFVQLFDVVACPKHALVVPEVVEIVPADPVHHVLVLIVKVNFEAVS